ncbi:5-hydroxytryptamine receptor 3A-like [Arapaima gigas]
MASVGLLLTLFLVSGVSASESDTGASAAEPHLARELDTVLGNETARLRPLPAGREPVHIMLDLRVLSIMDMDEKQERLLIYVLYGQLWDDRRLSWDPAHHHGVRRVTLPAEKLWVPDVILAEMVGYEEPPRSAQVSVSHLGQVEQWNPRLLQTSCPLDLYNFPLDQHTCNLTFGLLTHSREEAQVDWTPQLKEGWREWDWTFSMGEWEVTSLTVLPFRQITWSLNNSAIRVQVTVRRQPLFYLVTLLLPSSLLLVLDLLAFFIPPYLKQRLSVKATIFTGHFIFIVTIFTFFPPFTRDLPLIEVYLFCSLGLLACSTIETAMLFQWSNGRSGWVSDNIFPGFSRLLGWNLNKTADLLDEGPGWGPAAPDEETHALGVLQSRLAQVRRNLQQLRHEKDRHAWNQELGTMLDHTYLYLHCIALVTGGAILHTQWLRGP